MAIEYPIPRANAAPLDPRSGAFATEWYNFLRTLASQATNENLQAELNALAERVLALENGEALSANIVGLGSVLVTGSLSDGQVFVQLESDADSPAASSYYGTDADGAKGWFARAFLGLSDAPSDYTGAAGKVVAVNATEDGVEFVDQSGGVNNLDGGRADTVYGATTAIDGGGA